MIRTDYLVAAEAAAELLAAPELARAWERPSALAHYTVAGLAGHLAGQIFFAEVALAQPLGDADPIDIITYYDRVAWRPTTGSPGAVPATTPPSTSGSGKAARDTRPTGRPHWPSAPPTPCAGCPPCSRPNPRTG